MKARTKKAVVLVMALVLVLLPVLPYISAKADNSRFNTSLKVGFDNKAEIGRYVPFAVTVENTGEDFTGRLQVIVGNKMNYNIMYETDISIGRGETKTANFSCKVVDGLGKAGIRIENKKGKEIYFQELRYSVDKTASQKIDIGVLSDDFSALGYMDNLEFYDRETFKTNLVELTQDTFPEDVNSLDMLEVIIISNFSTDLLTDEQIEALNLWINRGGFLIIGTGSNSSKTLSKLNKNLIDVTPAKMNHYNTSFGLSYYTVPQGGNNTGNNYMDPYQDDEFMEDFNELYQNDRQYIDDTCREDFFNSYGYDEDYLYSDGTMPDYMEEEYYEFCLDYFYMFYTGSYYDNTPTFIYPTVTADILDFDDDASEPHKEELLGDGDLGNYILARIFERGSGKIILYGIDFTMNPLPNYECASDVFREFIQLYVLQGVIDYYDSLPDQSGYYNYSFGNTGYKNSYWLDNLIELTSSANLPPLALYVVPILGYMVALLVMYLVSKKKKKTFRLWYWYPIIALGVGVVVYCLGFSTRIIRPRINTMTVVELMNSIAVEDNFVSVTTPSNKVCEVGFSKDYDIQLMREESGYSYGKAKEVDLKSYRVAFRKDIDQTHVKFNGNVALGSDSFLLESIYPNNGLMEAQYVTNSQNAAYALALPEFLILKNNTGYDLENVVVISSSKASSSSYYSSSSIYCYRIGDWKNGQTIDMTAKDWNTGGDRSYSAVEMAFSDMDRHMISGFFLGGLSEGFNKYINRKNLVSYLNSEFSDEMRNGSVAVPENIICIVGFPTQSCCKDIQFGNKYRTERTEVIIQKIDKADMVAVVKK